MSIIDLADDTFHSLKSPLKIPPVEKVPVKSRTRPVFHVEISPSKDGASKNMYLVGLHETASPYQKSLLLNIIRPSNTTHHVNTYAMFLE